MLGDITSGIAKGAKRTSEAAVREVPYLRVANVQRGYLDLADVKTIYATEQDIAELALQDGDVLFNEGGDRDKLGRGWVWRNQIPECIHQNHVFRLRLYNKDMQAELISHHGNTFGKLWFQKFGKQTTNLASINKTVLRSFPVPVAPALEQVEISKRLRMQLQGLAEQEHELELAIKRHIEQRCNLYRLAFNGQLVPQDPKDEPSGTLLERIRTRRETRDSVSKIYKKIKLKEVAAMPKTLIDVLTEAGDWVPANDVFTRCGVIDGTPTEQIEPLYNQLRDLVNSGRVEVQPATDAEGRKISDQLKLILDK
jgi:type I restriction enzyme S subunit